MTLHIEKNKQLTQWLSETLTEISMAEFPIHVHNCPHCANPVRYPTVARKQKIDDFIKIMQSAYKVMERHGITANHPSRHPRRVPKSDLRQPINCNK